MLKFVYKYFQRGLSQAKWKNGTRQVPDAKFLNDIGEHWQSQILHYARPEVRLPSNYAR